MNTNTGRPYFLKRYLAYSLAVITTLWSGCGSPPDKPVAPAEPTTYRDTAFWQEYHEAYPIPQKLGSAEVRSIAVDAQDNVWIATASGVFRKAAGKKAWEDA